MKCVAQGRPCCEYRQMQLWSGVALGLATLMTIVIAPFAIKLFKKRKQVKHSPVHEKMFPMIPAAIPIDSMQTARIAPTHQTVTLAPMQAAPIGHIPPVAISAAPRRRSIPSVDHGLVAASDTYVVTRQQTIPLAPIQPTALNPSAQGGRYRVA